MAGIDKTYTNSYKDYKEFKDWADKQIVIFFDGHSECIGDWVYNYDEDYFDGTEIPIMNTPTWLDVYLINHCPVKFVVDRMKSVYGDSYNDYLNIEEFTKIPEGYEQNRKIVIKPSKGCKFPFKRKMFKSTAGKGKSWWWLQCDDNFWYNDETKKWIHWDSLYPHNTNTSHHKNANKSLIRFLRKQYLPKGIKFTLSGRYIGEEYDVFIR